MKITREVILDLLPVVLSGEASPATRALVDEYLKQDPELAERVRLQGMDALPRLEAGPRPEIELQSLRRTRALLALQRWLFAFAIMFVAIALATRITLDGWRVTAIRPLIFDYPAPFGTCLALGAAFYAAYRVVRWRLRTTSL